MGSREGLRLIATLIGGGFLVYAAIAILRGTLYDVDDGRVDRANRPTPFWLLVLSMVVLGVTILGVGWDWPMVEAVARFLRPG